MKNMLTDYQKSRREIECFGKSKPEEKKVYRIPKQSKKRIKENRSYKKDMQKDFEGGCRIKSPVCTHIATGYHHIQKTSPLNRNVKKNKIPACSECNLYVELNKDWAEKNGFFISKFKKLQNDTKRKSSKIMSGHGIYFNENRF
jgi:hypothetical protein